MVIKVELLDHMGSDLTVVNAARVSFDKESTWENILDDDAEFDFRLSDKDTKLIHYLAKHKHISPFGHCFLSFRINAPVFVARQLVKHKFLRWNEVSRRYVDSDPELYAPERWRYRADNVKQGSSQEETSLHWYMVDYDDGDSESLHKVVHDAMKDSFTAYKCLISAGIAPEQARMVLPQSMMTSWIWSGSLDAFVDMCRLRLDKHTQLETRMVAEGVAECIAEHFPVSWQALYGEEASAS